MRVLYCREAGFDCDGAVEAADDTAVLSQAEVHVREVHDVAVTPELLEQLRLLIRTADKPAATAVGDA